MRARLAAVALPLLALAGPASAQHLASAPPPPRTFGADTTATRTFTGQGLTPAGLSCDAAVPRTCSGFLASAVDGTLLEVTVRLPSGTGPHPLVVAMHGWGGGQGSMSKYDAPLLGEGYAVLRYSARGFGASWGQANLADVDVEGADLRSMIAQVVDLHPADVQGGAVALFGASYGGAHAWFGAVVPAFATPGGRAVVIRTIVPVASWTDLLNGLAPNGRQDAAHEVAGAQKLSFSEGLFLGGIRTRLERPYPNVPIYLDAWNVALTTNELPYGATPAGTAMVNELQGYRSVYWQQAFFARVRQNVAMGQAQLPIFLVQGFTDELFPAGEALRMYDALRSPSADPRYPIALYLGDLGHPRAANKLEEQDHVLRRLVLPWLGFYLKGAGTQPPFRVYAALTRPASTTFSASDVLELQSYTELSSAVAASEFPGTQVITSSPTHLSGFEWDPLVMTGCAQLDPCPPAPPADVVPGAVAAYEVAASALAGGPPFRVAGEPSVTLWASTLANRVQLDARLIDRAPDGTTALVTRGTFTLDAGAALPLRMVRVRIPMFANFWPVAPDHVLRLEITSVDSPYLRPSLVPSATAVTAVRLSIPVRAAPP